MVLISHKVKGRTNTAFVLISHKVKGGTNIA